MPVATAATENIPAVYNFYKVLRSLKFDLNSTATYLSYDRVDFQIQQPIPKLSIRIFTNVLTSITIALFVHSRKFRFTISELVVGSGERD